MNLIIDIGNTRIKVAVFQQYKLVDTEIISNDELIITLKNKQKR